MNDIRHNEATNNHGLSNEQTQHNPQPIVSKEPAKKAKQPPSKKVVEASYAKPKSKLDFTSKELETLKDRLQGISHFGDHLKDDDQDNNKNVVKLIEANIEALHKTFSVSFKAYKKEKAQHISRSFLTEFFSKCNAQLEEEKGLLEHGNGAKIEEVKSQQLSYTEDQITQPIDYEILNALRLKNKSVAKKVEFLKHVKAFK
nr:hypothetical protein [Moritella viscosa]SHO14745.1 DNA ligase-Polydeoxyribonucleotide synthase [NAD+] [Moritella viscosa]